MEGKSGEEKVITEYPKEFKTVLELNKGMRGGYGWTVKCRDDDDNNAFVRLNELNKRMNEEFGSFVKSLQKVETGRSEEETNS